MASCCGGGGDAVLKAKAVLGGQMQQVQTVSGNEMVRMEYTGEKAGAFTIWINGKDYRMNSKLLRFFEARPGDVKDLLMREHIRVVRSPGAVSVTSPVAPEPLKMNWGAVVQPEHTRPVPEKVTQAQPKSTPDENAGKLEIAPVFEDDYAVLNMTISDVKTALERGTDNITLLGWLTAEQQAEKPRSGVISAIEKALER